MKETCLRAHTFPPKLDTSPFRDCEKIEMGTNTFFNKSTELVQSDLVP
ncbi:MAG: hypothetical protein J5803_00165 [Desulfovibrio sp.]|nr:hypothetical protein [Desulfovibrio sp.]